jgi:hypothetical protein
VEVRHHGLGLEVDHGQAVDRESTSTNMEKAKKAVAGARIGVHQVGVPRARNTKRGTVTVVLARVTARVMTRAVVLARAAEREVKEVRVASSSNNYYEAPTGTTTDLITTAV